MNFNFISSRPAEPALPLATALPSDPLADAPLPCLYLLVAYLLARYGRGDAPRTAWLDRALPARCSVCRTLPRLLAAAQASPGVRRELDRWLDRELGAWAAGLEGRTPFELAALWAREREALAGPALAALVWVLARRNDLPARRIAARIGAAVDRRRLAAEPGDPCAPRRAHGEPGGGTGRAGAE